MQHTQKFHLKWQVAKFAEVAGVALKYNVQGPEGPGPLCNPEISFGRKEKPSPAVVYVTLRQDPSYLESM